MSVLSRGPSPAGVRRLLAAVRWPITLCSSRRDYVGLSIYDDSARLRRTAGRLGSVVAPGSLVGVARGASPSSMPEHFERLRPVGLCESSHRLVLSYFHGRPGHPSIREFRRGVGAAAWRRNAARVDRIQVTHDGMRELVLAAGVDPVAWSFGFRIGSDIEAFRSATTEARKAARKELCGTRDRRSSVGSFQKDGVGWDDGLEPKTTRARTRSWRRSSML